MSSTMVKWPVGYCAWSLVVVCFVVASTTAHAQPGITLTPRREATLRFVMPPTSPDSLRIDALGTTNRDRAVYGAHAVVQLQLVNINPFLYRYRISMVAVPIVETAPADFFLAAFGVNLPSKASSRDFFNAFNASDFTCGADGDPKPLNDDFHKLDVQSSKLHRVLDDAESEIDPLQTDAVLTQSVMKSPLSAAPDVYEAAQDFVGLADQISNAVDAAAKASAGIDDLIEGTAQLTQHALDFRKLHPNCTDIDAIIAETGKRSKDAQKLKDVRDALLKLQVNDNAAKTTAEIALKDGRNFYQVLQLGPYDDPQIDTIKIERKGVTADDKEYVPFTLKVLRFGSKRRLSFGAGIAYSELPVRQYQAVKRLFPAPLGRPDDTLRTVVEVENDTDRRYSPMLTLSTRLFDASQTKWVGDYVSSVDAMLGATIRKDVTTSAEFFVGGGIGLINDWVFVSYGLYIGSVTSLAGTSVGAILPSGTTTPPTKTRLGRQWSLMASFRLR